MLSGTIASTATCQLTATYDSPGLVVAEPSGFFEFKNADEFAALWAEYGDIPKWQNGTTRRCRGRGSHGLFLPGERKRLKKEDFEPEKIACA